MISNKATRIDLFSFSTPQMRAFHMTWPGVLRLLLRLVRRGTR